MTSAMTSIAFRMLISLLSPLVTSGLVLRIQIDKSWEALRLTPTGKVSFQPEGVPKIGDYKIYGSPPSLANLKVLNSTKTATHHLLRLVSIVLGDSFKYSHCSHGRIGPGFIVKMASNVEGGACELVVGEVLSRKPLPPN